ncbi:MAG: mechanosensitive ion channel family protein [Desulfarculaceae bacterium]|nr:mechanosensitive ion channel family protein [Desulfarculaceae bacterium]
MKEFFAQLRKAVLLEPLKISRRNRLKTYFISFFLVVTYVLYAFYKDRFDQTPLSTVMDILLVYFAMNVASHLGKIIILSSYRKRNKFHREHFDNLTIGITYVTSLILYLSFFTAVLAYLHVDIRTFLTIFGIFFAGLSWVLKEYVVSTINGLIIMFSRNFRIGDYILVNGNMGIIRNVTFLHTEIKTDEGNISYVPNNIILGNEVINFSKAKTKTIMFNLDIPSSHFNRLEALHGKMRSELIRAYPDIIEEVNMNIGRVKTGSANLKFQIVLKRYTFAIEKEIKNHAKLDLLTRISKREVNKTNSRMPRHTRRKSPVSADSYGSGV